MPLDRAEALLSFIYMDREQSIALWKKGKEAWNEWANGMLARREKLEGSGEWATENILKISYVYPIPFNKLSGVNQKTKEWLEEANVDFSKIWFFSKDKSIDKNKETEKPDNIIIATSSKSDINFQGYIFPNNVDFSLSEFNGVVNFNSSKFKKIAIFNFCKFKEDADFSNTKFDLQAEFISTKFGGNANFIYCSFSGVANFINSEFKGYADFSSFIKKEDKGFFKGKANFKFCKFKESANFNSLKFLESANFRLAHFASPVSFERTEFKKEVDFSAITSEKSFNLIDTEFTQVPNFIESSFHAPPVLDDMKIKEPLDQGWWTSRKTDARKFRALGKIAVDANDNQNAMEFFANEVRAKRGFQDKPFGKGSGRLWWGLFYDWFSDFGRSFWRPVFAWIITTLIFVLVYADASFNKVNYFDEPLYVAIRQGLVFSGLSKSDRWDSAIKVLYGVKENGGEAIIQIPNYISYLMLVQPIISAVWIFLFFLAMRKHFKIS